MDVNGAKSPAPSILQSPAPSRGVTNETAHQFPLSPLNCSGSQRTSDPLCTAGVLSADGWVAYDDTTNQVLTEAGGWAPSSHQGRRAQVR